MDWKQQGVAGVWEAADVREIVTTPRHVVIHRKDGCPLYLGREVALAAYGHALKQAERESATARQREAIVRDRRIDFAILGAVLLVLLVLAFMGRW